MNTLKKLAMVVLLAALGCTDSADVLTTQPANGATNVSPDTDIVVSFSRQMQTDTVTTDTFQVRGGFTGLSYAGTIAASEDSRTFTFTASAREGGGAFAAPFDFEAKVLLLGGWRGTRRITGVCVCLQTPTRPSTTDRTGRTAAAAEPGGARVRPV